MRQLLLELREREEGELRRNDVELRTRKQVGADEIEDAVIAGVAKDPHAQVPSHRDGLDLVQIDSDTGAVAGLGVARRGVRSDRVRGPIARRFSITGFASRTWPVPNRS
ncbi:MAG: hypothetical protein AB7N24_23235 [Dehalococcoidia bacterium]